ncbi:extracellular solute-binding protein [Candidatus Aerophobetes bacterium]|nr:extracellular solute-binding protein [Candidatus Aerophobetes bacterium]
MHRKKNKFLAGVGVLALSLTLMVVPQAVAQTEISIWTAFPEMHEFQKSAAETYEKLNPGIKVVATLFPQRALEEKVAAALPAGQAADLISMDAVGLYPYYLAGYVAQAPDDVAAWLVKNFPQSAIDFSKIPGTDKLFTIPLDNSLKLMFYNKDHFKQAGLAAPPQDIYEQMMYGIKLTKYDAAGNPTTSGLDLRVTGGGFGTSQKFWTQVMIPYGIRVLEAVTKEGKVLKGDEWRKYPAGELKWRAGYDNEAGRAALRYYIDACWKYKANSFDVKTDAEGFGLGVTSMFQRESWVVSYLRDYAPQINYGLFLMPKGPAGWGTVGNNMGLSLSKSSRQQKEAWDFAKFLVNDENSVKMFRESGWQPYRVNVDYSSLYKEQPQLKPFMDALQIPGFEIQDYVRIAPAFEIHSRFAEQLMIAFKRQDLVDNPEGIARVIRDAARETNRILDDYDLLAR